MTDEEFDLFKRSVVAIEQCGHALTRLADHFAPVEKPREKRPAILGTATYSREERAGKEVRETLSGGAQKPAPGAAGPTRAEL